MSDERITQETEKLTLVEIGMDLIRQAAEEARAEGDARHEFARKLEGIIERWKNVKGAP